MSVYAAVLEAFPMIKANDCRARADQCEREAKLAVNTEIREQLERVAQQWRELAQLRERRARDER